jgi:hypothetical protein
MQPLIWGQIQGQQSRTYTCGYCGMPLASEKGWRADRNEQRGNNWVTVQRGSIYVCHNCHRPTFFDESGKQFPGVAYGESVKNVSDASLNEIYEEARKATSAGCYTAAVLCCRKLLMHLAVAKGAKEGESFKNYVEYLAAKNYVPPDCRLWVDQIRDTGNEANHEIVLMKQEDAEHLISFCEMLLKIFYEFPAVARARAPKAVAATA